MPYLINDVISATSGYQYAAKNTEVEVVKYNDPGDMALVRDLDGFQFWTTTKNLTETKPEIDADTDLPIQPVTPAQSFSKAKAKGKKTGNNPITGSLF